MIALHSLPLLKSAIYIALALFLTTITASDLVIDGGDTKTWEKWRVGVDGVMGGKSTGFVSYDYLDAKMNFYGTIDLDGGGFASIGRSISTLDLSKHDGIVITMDAQEYGYSKNTLKPFGFHLQFQDARSRFGYAAAFAVPLAEKAGMETNVFLPIKEFDRGSFMGFQCESCELDSTQINGIEIYALFQEGDFIVRIKSITAVEKEQSFKSPAVAFESSNEIETLIQATIAAGSTVYDNDYIELCTSIYWSTLNTLLEASTGVSDALKGVVSVGVRKISRASTKAVNARTLRYTLDAVLGDLQGVDRDSNLPSWLPEKIDVATAVERQVGYTSIPTADGDGDLTDLMLRDTTSAAVDAWFLDNKLILFELIGFMYGILP